MIKEILFFAFGLFILIKGSDYFVDSAASIAKKLGVSDFVVGLTLVALGTSIPELASSVIASLRGNGGLVIGNVVGSNIANIGLIVGFAAVISVIKTNEDMLRRDGYIMMFVSLLFFALAWYGGGISFIDAIIFLVLYVVYNLFLFSISPKDKKKYHFREFLDYVLNFRYLSTAKELFNIKSNKKGSSILLDLVVMILGGCAVVFGAKFLVEEALFFASFFGIPDTIIGVLFVAMGTSLPELSVSITAARKGYGNIAVGNIIGSNIANILLILGVSGIIAPIVVGFESLWFLIPFMLVFSVLLLFFIKSNWEIRKAEGITFLVLYSAFIFFLFTKFL